MGGPQVRREDGADMGGPQVRRKDGVDMGGSQVRREDGAVRRRWSGQHLLPAKLARRQQ